MGRWVNEHNGLFLELDYCTMTQDTCALNQFTVIGVKRREWQRAIGWQNIGVSTTLKTAPIKR